MHQQLFTVPGKKFISKYFIQGKLRNIGMGDRMGYLPMLTVLSNQQKATAINPKEVPYFFQSTENFLICLVREYPDKAV
jgi:hypothetical protein